MAPAQIPSSPRAQTTQEVRGRALKRGIYVPTVAFFLPNEDIDIETIKRHATFLAASGVTGIVTHGSNGEAVHVDHEERAAITKATREALDLAGKQDMVVIAGCGAHSTRETIKLCKDAAASGAEYALVLPPSYYGSLLTSDMLLNHYREVANASPIPLIIYNFPGAASGLDMTSDQIIALAQHANITGVKLTCGNTGKLARIAAAAPKGFLTTGGSADFLNQTLVAGGQGVIAGLANLCPRSCVKTMQLYESGKVAEAQKMQAVLARADWVAIKGGFVAVKCGLQAYQGYGGRPRKPCALPGQVARDEIVQGFAEVMELEGTL